MGGGNPDTNPRLRRAIDSAKDAGMPKDTIERAIKRGTGELPGVSYEEAQYEGYGPDGVAFLIEVLTDNKNRTTNEIRRIFSKHGGNLGSTGCVAWMFEPMGLIYVDQSVVSEDKLYEIALDAGAEDITVEGDAFKITTKPENFEQVKNALKENGIKWRTAELTKVPQNYVKITDRHSAEKILKLMEDFEAQDDVQRVHANFDIPDEILEEVASKT